MTHGTLDTAGGGPLVLVVLDGWGLREEREGNAVKLARTPTYLELLNRFPHSSLVTPGEAAKIGGKPMTGVQGPSGCVRSTTFNVPRPSSSTS